MPGVLQDTETPLNADVDHELPEYSPGSSPAAPTPWSARELTTHAVELINRKQHPWVKLNVKSKANPSSRLPLVVEGEPITGDVEFDLKEETTIKSIAVTVVGELITTYRSQNTFVQVTEQLWSNTQGDPRVSPETRVTTTKFKGKLSGKFSLPFSVGLPKEVEIKPRDGQPNSYQLPSTFFMRGARVTVNYRVFTTISRGTFQPDSILGTNISYVAQVTPDPPSVARQLAYQETNPLLGPDADPEGWHTLPTVTMRGKLFSARMVEAQYTLSLAKPLSYTRGSVIPLHLVVECKDEQGLDILSLPRGPSIRLRRSIAMIFPEDAAMGSSGLQFRKLTPAQPAPFQDLVSDVETAAWWPDMYEDAGAKVEGRRVLQGELRLPKSTFPSAHLADYRVSYEVAMYRTEVTGFQSEKDSKERLQTVPVIIATSYPNGPRPLSYAPPDYAWLSSTDDTNQPSFTDPTTMVPGLSYDSRHVA